jgi:hypothetical protein
VKRDELRGRLEGEPDVAKFGVGEQVLGWLTTEVSRVIANKRLVPFQALRRETIC